MLAYSGGYKAFLDTRLNIATLGLTPHMATEAGGSLPKRIPNKLEIVTSGLIAITT